MEDQPDTPRGQATRGPRLSAEDKRQRNSYLREFLPAIVTFWILLAIVQNTVDENTSGARLWVLVPVLPMIGVAFALYRATQRADEYGRIVMLECMALGLRGLDDRRHGPRVPRDDRRCLDLRRVAGLRRWHDDVGTRPHRSEPRLMDNRLKELRAVNSWSQAHLADLLGVSRQTVNALEKGRYDPSLPLAFRLARVFSTTIEDLFTPDEDDLGETTTSATSSG